MGETLVLGQHVSGFKVRSLFPSSYRVNDNDWHREIQGCIGKERSAAFRLLLDSSRTTTQISGPGQSRAWGEPVSPRLTTN
jgi:hypothetical protein